MSTDRKIHKPESLPDHERPLGRFRAEGHDVVFRPLASLAEARAAEDGVVILQGDDGGQVYVVCSAAQVQCSESALEQLLVDLDELAWPGNDPSMRRIYFEQLACGSGIAGGMGGGEVGEQPWIHRAFIDRGLGSVITDVLGGIRARVR